MTDNTNQINTRTMILEKARHLFLSLGYHKTTMRNIADVAGISTGPLYFYFQNKAEVFFHICNEAFDYLIVDFRRVASDDSHAGLRLRNIYYSYKTFYYQEPQLFEIMHLPTNPMLGIDLPQTLEETLKQKSQELVKIMEGVIQEGIIRQELRPVDPCKLALYLYSVAEGIFLSSRLSILQQCNVSLDEMIDTAIELIGVGMIEFRAESPHVSKAGCLNSSKPT
ncbi:TetR/AcrR family transcriptional regulator [Sporomusa malonica]|uniref:Transcriptional regulator, TetR family n=1 Tax=Sporomusa malonica TaxID=112901 RepID=A0A1W2CXP0_9FIRM|nr:TetR/AcrR family transcriptional regulator [Sporomusa malonica]SMC89920.1 transcriptional regulator, TetR family [Sporomusa malonica]